VRCTLRAQAELLAQADVVVLHNVFEWFHEPAEQRRLWTALHTLIRRRGPADRQRGDMALARSGMALARGRYGTGPQRDGTGPRQVWHWPAAGMALAHGRQTRSSMTDGATTVGSRCGR
jgi:hypothetical protein